MIPAPEQMQSLFPDPEPAKIDLGQWHTRFKDVPQSLLDGCRYYRWAGDTAWNPYLQPPSFFNIYGARVMRGLRFDNSLAALRLWGFALNEGERVFRARQAGKKIVALMGDYGALAPLVYAFDDLVPFYPDYQYWTPFFNESTVLLDTADRAGIGENCCFVRASLAAFLRGAYFPAPDLVIAATGAGCDDLNAVAQRVADMDVPFHWTEMPQRKDPMGPYAHLDFECTAGGVPFDTGARDILVEEYEAVLHALSDLSETGAGDDGVRRSLAKVNAGRGLIRRIREAVFSAPVSPLPALELMLAEFAGPAFYADLDECVAVLDHLLFTVKRRVETGTGVGSDDDRRVAWATPPPDPRLLDRMEDLGGRLAATEFLVAQSRAPIREDGPPLVALAESFLEGSLLGSSGQRADRLAVEAVSHGAEGAVISGLFASSHCVFETRVLREDLARAIAGPVLTLDVPSPGGKGLRNPVENRLAAFMEALRNRR